MPSLRPGDIFCTRNPMALGRAICAIERFNDVDNQARYSHSGIILGPTGTTFEALWTNKMQNIFNAYAGIQVLIGRHEGMTPKAFSLGWANVRELIGNVYPFHRLVLNLVPPVAKYLAVGKYAVCSELAAKFLVGAGIFHFWAGVTPDYMSDTIRDHKGWQIVFEGILPATVEEFMQLDKPGGQV